MAKQAQENSWELNFPAPQDQSCHGMPAGGTKPLGRIQGQTINPLTMGNVRLVVRQARSENNGSTGRYLSHNFARPCNPSFGGITLATQISLDINDPGWKGSAAPSTASPAANRRSPSFNYAENQTALKLTTGEQ